MTTVVTRASTSTDASQPPGHLRILKTAIQVMMIVFPYGFDDHRCRGFTKMGLRCRRDWNLSSTGYCELHDPDGRQCRAIADSTGHRCRMRVDIGPTGYCKYHDKKLKSCRGIASSTGRQCEIKWDLDRHGYSENHGDQYVPTEVPTVDFSWDKSSSIVHEEPDEEQHEVRAALVPEVGKKVATGPINAATREANCTPDVEGATTDEDATDDDAVSVDMEPDEDYEEEDDEAGGEGDEGWCGCSILHVGVSIRDLFAPEEFHLNCT